MRACHALTALSIHSAGDLVQLCHVVCNERVAPTSVGTSGVVGRSVMSTDDQGRQQNRV